MAVIQDGVGSQLMAVDASHLAGRVTMRPHVALGHYSLGAFSGLLTGAGAGASVFVMRWTDANALCLIHKVTLKWVTTTAFTTAQRVTHTLVRSRSWTVAPSAGTQITLGVTAKRRTSYPDSRFAAADVRIAAAAAVTVGTRTADANALACVQAWSGAAGAGLPETELWVSSEANGGPIVLAQNEGIEIQSPVAMGAAGVIELGVEVDWAEVLLADWQG